AGCLNLPELSILEEADVTAVGRPERIEGIFGARNRRCVERSERSQPESRFPRRVSRDKSESEAVGGYDRNLAEKRPLLRRRNREADRTYFSRGFSPVEKRQ